MVIRCYKIIFSLLIIVSSSPCGAASAAKPIDAPLCPPSISLSQTIIGPVPAGWTVLHSKVEHVLNNIGFLAGADLVENPELVPQTIVLGFFKKAYVWNFTNEGDILWIGCSYTDTDFEVYARLPRRTGSCEVFGLDVSCAPSPNN